MADDLNHASGAGAGSHGGCPIGRDVGHGAAGSSNNPRRSKRQREQEEDQGTAGEDPGMHMTCMMKIEWRAHVWGVVLLQPWGPVMVTSGRKD
jgi:hypothetical protein